MKQKINIRVGSERGSGTLGTFSGVFTPSILTILGIIFFRRLGYVVGIAGLWQAVVVIALANLISILTSISLSAIATNFRVKGGGDYYLISRTLGVEFGGAIGIVLFLAQAVSIAFYCIGFGEALAGIFAFHGDYTARMIAAAAAVVIFLFAWQGADWATRLQFFIMVVLGGALVAFFAGAIGRFDSGILSQNLAPSANGPGFWVIFAIFFPAVTGFTQGVSLSGDLRDPGRSIPIGTFMAVGLSMVVYFGAAILFAGALPGADLISDYEAMRRTTSWGWLIDAGVIAATLSSAMASSLGAPRILQALAADRVIRLLKPFAAGVGPSNNPRRGVLLSAVIAFTTIALGNLNLIAPVVSMFFLISYGLLNYATYFEARASSPSFRPRFRWFDRRLSLFGALGCFAVMLAINLTAGVVSLALLFAIYQYLKRTAGPSRWADGSRAYLFKRVRDHLFEMASSAEHDRDWRPQILAFSKANKRREHVLRFASWIEGGSGLTTAVEIVEGDRETIRLESEPRRKALEKELAEHGVKAFSLTVGARDVRTGLEYLLQCYGIGPMKANIVLLNWFDQLPGEDLSEERQYGRYLRETIRLGCNLVVVDSEKREWDTLIGLPAEGRRIDVWWWGTATGRLNLLLAYLMTRTDEWRDASIRLLTPRGKKSREKSEEQIQQILEAVRIDAESVVVDNVDLDVMVEHSADAAIVFVPMILRGNQPVDPFGERLEPLLSRLPVVALSIAAEDIRLLAEPDEGKPAEIAAAAEAADEAARALNAAEKGAESAAGILEAAKKKLTDIENSKKDVLLEARSEAEAAVAAADQAARRAEKELEAARTKAGQAVDRAEETGFRSKPKG